MKTNATLLLADALDAHGGHARWHRFQRVSATIVTGGFLWGVKGIEMDDKPRLATSELHHQWTSVEPFCDPDWRMVYTPERVVIATRAGTVVAERDNPRESFAGHKWETLWDPLQLGYFTGCAVWTYCAVPFVLAERGFKISASESIVQDGETLHGLRARVPQKFHTHSAEQWFYFGADGLLRRHDYRLDVAGRRPGVHLLSDYIDVQGLRVPTKRRVYMRKSDGAPNRDKMTMSIDLSNYKLS
jgi:hypothetical protein